MHFSSQRPRLKQLPDNGFPVLDLFIGVTRLRCGLHERSIETEMRRTKCARGPLTKRSHQAGSGLASPQNSPPFSLILFALLVGPPLNWWWEDEDINVLQVGEAWLEDDYFSVYFISNLYYFCISYTFILYITPLLKKHCQSNCWFFF